MLWIRDVKVFLADADQSLQNLKNFPGKLLWNFGLVKANLV